MFELNIVSSQPTSVHPQFKTPLLHYSLQDIIHLTYMTAIHVQVTMSKVILLFYELSEKVLTPRVF